MKNATVTKTIDTSYKNGFVHCESCGWHKHFGDGFNQYYLESCPNCDTSISTRIQKTVTTGRKGNYEVKHGIFYYFAMSNGIHSQYKTPIIYRTEYKSHA